MMPFFSILLQEIVVRNVVYKNVQKIWIYFFFSKINSTSQALNIVNISFDLNEVVQLSIPFYV